ncbi:uncharacterized protein [Epargyreus clarus]|uniref:uncharacterized protein n=1 Tax=Epargyreus clarus TaxID=520877 RepID=UPI003C2B805D
MNQFTRKFNKSSQRSTNTCGLDKSPISVVYEGVGVIETYPWLGTLYYPVNGKRYITAVVLVSKQIVIGSAIDIDKLPKRDFRSRSRVVLGTNCSGASIRIREYAYHPAYNTTTYSAIALIQLETAYLIQELRPICPPPAVWNKPQFYAMTLSDNCKDSKIHIHRMSYVSLKKCKNYYTKTELNVESMWPTHTVCARTSHGRACVWKTGAVLMMRQDDRWSLTGFGVSGPGCRAPARFIDYGVIGHWVTHSIARIGRPAVTRLARNQVVMRRTLSKLQRYGPCDPEELKAELFTDRTSVTAEPNEETRRIRYNFTIISNTEYSCIIFRVDNERDSHQDPPYIRLRRWCNSRNPICYSFQYLQIDLYVEIIFSGDVTYNIAAYGKEATKIDMKKVTAYFNHKREFPEVESLNFTLH